MKLLNDSFNFPLPLFKGLIKGGKAYRVIFSVTLMGMFYFLIQEEQESKLIKGLIQLLTPVNKGIVKGLETNWVYFLFHIVC